MAQQEFNKWNSYFMDIALRTSELSKDAKTKVGAVIVKNNTILSIGYNGAPKDFNDELVPKTNNELLFTSKNSYMIHAEINAVLNYRGDIKDLNNAIIYVTSSPCHNCMLVLAQLGIKIVYYHVPYDSNKDEYKTANFIAEECGIDLRRY